MKIHDSSLGVNRIQLPAVGSVSQRNHAWYEDMDGHVNGVRESPSPRAAPLDRDGLEVGARIGGGAGGGGGTGNADVCASESSPPEMSFGGSG